MECQDEFDYVVVNHNGRLDKAVEEIDRIIQDEKGHPAKKRRSNERYAFVQSHAQPAGPSACSPPIPSLMKTSTPSWKPRCGLQAQETGRPGAFIVVRNEEKETQAGRMVPASMEKPWLAATTPTQLR